VIPRGGSAAILAVLMVATAAGWGGASARMTIARCRADQVAIRVYLAGTTQSLLGTFAVRNTSNRACSVRGHPAVLIFDGSGHRLRIHRFVQDKGDRSSQVRLVPGKRRATFTAQWFNFCGRQHGVPELRVALPRSHVQIAVKTVRYTPLGYYPVCADPHRPSDLGITHLRRPTR
jgi:hypothetical protein